MRHCSGVVWGSSWFGIGTGLLNSPPMSALGQKQTCAAHKLMSAFPPIATVKADIRKRSCLLYPRKQACAAHSLMSALGQKRTFALTHSSVRKRPNCRGSAKGRDVPNRVSCQRRKQEKSKTLQAAGRDQRSCP